MSEQMTVHICSTDPRYEVFRRSVGERWCFQCRKRRQFVHVRSAPVEMSYYGPIDQIECVSCGLVDGDLFPGHTREWE